MHLYDTQVFAASAKERRRGSVVVSTPAWHAVVRGSIIESGMLY